MSRIDDFQKNILILFGMILAFVAFPIDAFACDQKGLEVCLSFGGGQACYQKHQCSQNQDPINRGRIDYALGERFADAAYGGSAGYSRGLCYQYVWFALRDVLGMEIESLPVPARSAFMFGDWVDANPVWARRELKLERRSMSRIDAPNGSVLVWEPGECGYNSVHGHIEIVVQRGQTACSDFCGTIRKGCGSPRIYVPVY